MKKIVYLPLDERPCNYYFPLAQLCDNEQYHLVVCPKYSMGDKKKPADFHKISSFLLSECLDADALVISIDTLLYGGIVPSRLHNLTEQELEQRLSLIDILKKNNAHIKIFAFSLIMRCPQYSSDDEEPTYYQDCGKEIFKRGEILHKIELNIVTKEEQNHLQYLIDKTNYCIDDYLSRRKINLSMNLNAVAKVGKSIDFLVLPQDDSSVYGYIVKDQTAVKRAVELSECCDNIFVYPGADEVGMMLVARFINKDKGVSLSYFVEYSSSLGGECIPLYEDREMSQTLRLQILCSGGKIAVSKDKADIMLYVNSPSTDLINPNMLVTNDIISKRQIEPFIEDMTADIINGRQVAIADTAYCNGGDTQLVKLLEKRGLLMRVTAYSGWNTSSNTIGTTVATSALFYHFGATRSLTKFLALRYFEDIGYCAYTRKYLCDNFIRTLGLNYFNSGEREGVVSRKVEETITQYMSQVTPSLTEKYKITKCYLPWIRMFEVGLEIDEKN
ncbi:MAG: DUF4127 family protein [Clostridia bacterium]